MHFSAFAGYCKITDGCICRVLGIIFSALGLIGLLRLLSEGVSPGFALPVMCVGETERKLADPGPNPDLGMRHLIRAPSPAWWRAEPQTSLRLCIAFQLGAMDDSRFGSYAQEVHGYRSQTERKFLPSFPALMQGRGE